VTTLPVTTLPVTTLPVTMPPPLPTTAMPPTMAEEAPVAPPPVPPAPRTWTVAPGQHFWAVAEMVLTEAWSRAPSDREMDPYWRTLIETNRLVLRDPANPDLLYPDQVLMIPPPPPAPA
ncbi:MAG: hypothetical protein ACRDY5_09775, partial [Acidimicrobiales bacterium]